MLDYLEPSYIEIEPVRGCNLRCRMCHVSFKKETLAYLDLDRINSFSFLRNKMVMIGGAYEPLIHPQINKLIDILNRNRCKLAIVTNGHNLHKKKIPALFDADLDQVIFSFDGTSKETYEAIRVGGNYANTLTNIENFRASFSTELRPTFVLNYTVLRSNMQEVAAAPEFWNIRGIDVLTFVAMHVRYDDPYLVENSLWPVRNDYYDALDIASQNACNKRFLITLGSPYYQSERAFQRWGSQIQDGHFCAVKSGYRRLKHHHRMFQFGAEFGMKFPCKSPFVAARIMWDGRVNLCSNVTVGNLYDNQFKEIWHGAQAALLRNKLLMDESPCEVCDYFRLCIDSHSMDLDDLNDHNSQSMIQSHRAGK